MCCVNIKPDKLLLLVTSFQFAQQALSSELRKTLDSFFFNDKFKRIVATFPFTPTQTIVVTPLPFLHHPLLHSNKTPPCVETRSAK
jgi:hypothetical protein